jgi:hypothetical protein
VHGQKEFFTMLCVIEANKIDFDFDFAYRPCGKKNVSLYMHLGLATKPLALGLITKHHSHLSTKMGVGLQAEWLERCASISKITGSNPSGGSELTFRSDLLLTARGGTA